MPRYCLLFSMALIAPGAQAAAQEYLSNAPLSGTTPEAWRGAELPLPIASSAAESRPEPVERLGDRLTESSWSARIDYFHWNERLDGQDFVNEDGSLVTLSYVRRVGPERFRAELFGGNVGYGAEIDYDDGTSEFLSSHTSYLGLCGEYDLMYEPDWWPAASLFAGFGTRFWFRDLPDETTALGTTIWGYRETWWTMYPYLGVETRGSPTVRDLEFFGSVRIGSTAFTYENVTWNDVTLYPEIGLTGQLELGLRGPRLFLSAHCEAMTWGESDAVRDSWQPRSRMVTVGLKTGFRF
jgi:hypothetical protein